MNSATAQCAKQEEKGTAERLAANPSVNAIPPPQKSPACIGKSVSVERVLVRTE